MAREFRDLLTKGLKRPGKPGLLSRIGFLLRSVRDDRGYQAGLTLEARKRGGRKPGGGKRLGAYANAYAKGRR